MLREDIQFPPRHNPLREDIHTLGQLLGSTLQEQGGKELLALVEADRQAAILGRSGAPEVDVQLQLRVRGRPPELALDMVRAFSGWFQMTNIAEKVHRIRRRREYYRQPGAQPQPGGIGEALAELKSQGMSLAAVLKLFGSLSIEPVLIAHPIESTRRTTLRRQQRVADLLLEYSNPLLAPYERQQLLDRIRQEVTTEWQTAEHPRERLTVADEREHAIFYLGEVLYFVVSDFYEEITAALSAQYGVEPETIELPQMLRFGTWVGGDMDGLTDVHAKSIRDTLARQQQFIIGSYYAECLELAQVLSQSAGRVGVSPELTRRVAEYRILLPGAHGLTPSRHDPMPYRVLLGQVAERLQLTQDGRANAYEQPAQFRADIELVVASLRANRGVHAGFFAVRRLLSRIDTFGFHLATLDLRQHTDVHHEVLAQGLDDPQWPQRSPEQRRVRLLELLTRDVGPCGVFDALGKRTLAVFDAIMQGRHRYGADAVGLYIISGAATADDVLAPLVLARWAKACDRRSGEAAIDVAPQFDSVDTLEACGEVMSQLLNEPVYRRHLDARGKLQTVLVGYSDSNRESGIVASRLAAYRAQRSLTWALQQAGKDHVLFYSRGGSIPRGGGRIDELLRAAPAESVSGVLRFTEQGESVNQNYGLRSNAIRTLERAFSTLTGATLAVKRGVAVQEAAAMAECAAAVAAQSRTEWRELVHAGSRFYEYFRAVTPIDVIERMQIGTYLAPRRSRTGIDSVRPVAWVYAWSQSRHMLPGWFGAGAGFQAVSVRQGIEPLRRCYRGWPFFRNLVDEIEAMLGRTDLRIGAYYESLAPAELRGYGAQIRAEFERTCALVLDIKQSHGLLDTDPTLQRAVSLRNPYVDPMNLMQVDLLERWRAGGREDGGLFSALVATVGGIARGLQTTG